MREYTVADMKQSNGTEMKMCGKRLWDKLSSVELTNRPGLKPTTCTNNSSTVSALVVSELNAYVVDIVAAISTVRKHHCSLLCWYQIVLFGDRGTQLHCCYLQVKVRQQRLVHSGFSRRSSISAVRH